MEHKTPEYNNTQNQSGVYRKALSGLYYTENILTSLYRVLAVFLKSIFILCVITSLYKHDFQLVSLLNLIINALNKLNSSSITFLTVICIIGMIVESLKLYLKKYKNN